MIKFPDNDAELKVIQSGPKWINLASTEQLADSTRIVLGEIKLSLKELIGDFKRRLSEPDMQSS